MTFSQGNFFRSGFAALLLVVCSSGFAARAEASVNTWLQKAVQGSYSKQITFGGPPATAFNLNEFTGDRTYEFVVNGSDSGTSSILGSLVDGNNQAIRFNQYDESDLIGITQYGLSDFKFSYATPFNTDVVLAFVSDSIAGTTRLFVNGVDTGSTVPVALTLDGDVGLGATATGPSTFLGQDTFSGTISALAVYQAKLSAADLKLRSDAYFEVVPEPTAWTSLLAFGAAALILRRRRA